MESASYCGGFEYQFVSTPLDIFVCKICRLPSRDPHLTMCCGHVFCKSCLDGMKEVKSMVYNKCPVCRGEDFVTFPNKQTDREVKSLCVYCTNKGRGCKWQGEVNYIDNHLTNDGGCGYQDVLCSSGCSGLIQRRDLTKHVENECPRRKVNCQYCHLRGEHQKEDCIEYPLACPNKCEEAGCIRRKDMNEHRSRCPLEVINCEYETMGCEVRMTRQTQQEHNEEKMEYHLHLTKCKLVEVSDELSKTKSTLDQMKLKLFQALKLANSHLNESNFKLPETCEQLSIAANELCCENNEFYKSIGDLENMVERNKTKMDVPMCDWLIQLKLCSATSLSSPENPVTFKVARISKKILNNRNWCSKPFSTSSCWYNLEIAFARWDKTHCKVFVQPIAMKGQFDDDDLYWPTNQKFTITLMNQISDTEHYSGTICFNDAVDDRHLTHRVLFIGTGVIFWGDLAFISHEELTKITPTCQYVKNDCMFVKISVS